jgi:LPXTG-motif cell wall-anchored protein
VFNQAVKRVVAVVVTTIGLMLIAPTAVFASTPDPVDSSSTELAETGAAFVPMLLAAGITLALAGLAVVIAHRRVARTDS